MCCARTSTPTLFRKNVPAGMSGPGRDSCGKILLELFVSDLGGTVSQLVERSPTEGNQETDCRINSCSNYKVTSIQSYSRLATSVRGTLCQGLINFETALIIYSLNLRLFPAPCDPQWLRAAADPAPVQKGKWVGDR